MNTVCLAGKTWVRDEPSWKIHEFTFNSEAAALEVIPSLTKWEEMITFQTVAFNLTVPEESNKHD